MFLRSVILSIVVGPISTFAAVEFPELPYAYDALQPIISEQTLRTHHLKHHAKYVNVANHILHEGEATMRHLSPDDIIQNSEIRESNPKLFNNAAQSWNHAFYWKCMTTPGTTTEPGGGGEPSPTDVLGGMIRRDFGSYAKFRAELETAATTAFGSGWAWVAYDKKNDKLLVMKTTGAENPMSQGLAPILTIDVWEHAYYLDMQDRRDRYVKGFLDRLVDWSFAEQNLKRAVGLATDEL